MITFPDIDPQTIEQNPHLVAKIPDYDDERSTYYFLVVDNHLIIVGVTDYVEPDTGERKLLHDQIVFPKQGLLWYLDSLKNRFFKTEAEGGLPKGTFHDKTVIDGERLKLGRAFNADGHGGGGYSFVTLDRKENYGMAQEHLFTDTFLFEGGLIQVLEKIAAKIRSGQL